MRAARYRLTGRLESGELAELFEAVRGDGEAVVVKLFHERTTDERYAREQAQVSRQLAGLDGEGVVRVLELGLLGRRLALVRQRVDGFTLGTALQRLVAKDAVLQPPLALDLIIQLLEVLQRAHDAGVVHGALTPGNVFVDRRGQPVLCDFGALAALHAVPALRRVYGPRGRDAYRAPEVVKGELPTAAADLFSVGALAYELLTLHEPLLDQAGSVGSRRRSLPPPSRLDRRLSARLDPLILRAMEASPQRRYKTCSDFSEALRAFLAQGGGIPAKEELGRFVHEVLARPSPAVGGGLPLTESFGLSEVSGAELADVPERIRVLVTRPSFSGGGAPSEEEVPATERAPPAAAVFDPASDAATRPMPGVEELIRSLDESTDPGATVNVVPEDLLAAGASGPRAGAQPAPTPTAISPSRTWRRMRIVEDYSPPPVEESHPGVERPRRAGRKRPLLAPPLPEELVITAPLPAGDLPAALGQVRDTVEGPLLPRGNPRRLLALLVGLAVVVLSVGAFGLLRRNGPPSPLEVGSSVPVPDPAARQVDEALKVVLEGQPAPAAEAADVDQPPPLAKAAFMTVRSDVPARVFVDGRRVPGETPMRRYPVRPGQREIAVQSVYSGELRRRKVRFSSGRARIVEERFGSGAAR